MAKYQLKKIIKRYSGPAKTIKTAIVDYELLECGHSIYYREPKSRGEAIRILGGGKRRCYECAQNDKKLKSKKNSDIRFIHRL